MKRTTFLDLLERAAPALDAKNPNGLYGCFQFKGDKVTAHDGVVAIRVEIGENPIVGCVSGALLLSLLRASGAKELEFGKVEGDAIKIKAGRSRLRLAVIDADEFPFVWELSGKHHDFNVTPELQAAIRTALIAGGETATPGYQGINLAFPDTGSGVVYSTDEVTATRILFKGIAVPQALVESAVVLPVPFAKILTDASGAQLKNLCCYANGIVGIGSGWWLYGARLERSDVKEYAVMFAKRLPSEDRFFNVPTALRGCVERAALAVAAGGGPFTDVTIAGGRLCLATMGPAGDVVDRIRLLDYKGPDVSVKIVPKLLQRGLTLAEGLRIAFGSCVYLEGGGVSHLISVMGKE